MDSVTVIMDVPLEGLKDQLGTDHQGEYLNKLMAHNPFTFAAFSENNWSFQMLTYTLRGSLQARANMVAL